MKIPSNISYIRKVSKEIENFLNKHNIDESDIFDIRLCAEEAVRNSILHGNKGNKDLPVTISYFLDDNKFTLEVEDEGKGFDPKNVPDPTRKENLLTAGGRGVFLIEKLMDEAEYKCGGKKIFMVKFVNRKKE